MGRKWANIVAKKTAKDGANSKVYAKFGVEIYVAAKQGEPDPESNSALKFVLERAKQAQVPKHVIDKAIDKAKGNTDETFVEGRYEGFGPNGSMIIVDTLTSNVNRTAANVRSAFTKGGGSIGTSGCVSFMFDKKGQIIIDKEECDMDADDLMMIALDAGAEDFSDEEDSYEIITDPDDFSAVRDALEKEGIPMAEAEVTMVPQTWATLTNEDDIKKMNRILDLLDEDDDVQNVYHNWDE